MRAHPTEGGSIATARARNIGFGGFAGFAGFAAAVIALGLFGSETAAHEMGAMKVSAAFAADSSYRIEIVVDGEHLPRGISPFPSMAEQAAGLSDKEREQRFERFRKQFLDAVRLLFDGAPAAPSDVESGPIPSSTGTSPGGSKLAFTLTGTVPRGAKTFAWSHAMVLGTYLLRVQNEGDLETSNQWLDSGRTSRSFPLRPMTPPPTLREVMARYLGLGYTRIVPGGPAYILFVLAIFLFSFKPGPILMQVAAFAAAQSIALVLALYGVVSLPPRVVESLIALSIVYLAVENLIVHRFTPWRTLLVFCFGLLHGIAIAGALRDLRLPRTDFLPALVSFDVGVEAAQMTVIAAATLLVGVWFGKKSWYRPAVTMPASAAIALAGTYWGLLRLSM